MASTFPPWRLTLARIEGALPFISNELAECLALASLRRLWRCHVRNCAVDIAKSDEELTRSSRGAERAIFLSWIARHASPALAHAARIVLVAKNQPESLSASFASADYALAQLDALLQGGPPVPTLLEWIAGLQRDGVSESWAASLAAAARPQLFGFGPAPFALTGLIPPALFQSCNLSTLLASALNIASEGLSADLHAMHNAVMRGNELLGGLYASSTAPQAWRLISSLGPLTRAELARAIGVTKRTASKVSATLEQVGLACLNPMDKTISAISR